MDLIFINIVFFKLYFTTGLKEIPSMFLMSDWGGIYFKISAQNPV